MKSFDEMYKVVYPEMGEPVHHPHFEDLDECYRHYAQERGWKEIQPTREDDVCAFVSQFGVVIAVRRK